MAKKNITSAEDLFGDFFDTALDISLTQVGNEIGIVEFAENIIFNGEESLYPPQRAILKAFYGEPLTEDELLILYGWKEDEYCRTTWVDGREYTNLVLEAGRGSGKALALNTPILTTKGWTTIKDVIPGDYVFNQQGMPVKVLAESEIFIGHKTYEVQFSDGSFITADADHQWLTWDKAARKSYSRAKNPRCHPTVKTTEEIKNTLFHNRKDSRKELNHSISLADPIQFSDKDLPIHPYVLGLWLGDGNSRDSRITMSIEDSKEILFKLTELGFFFTVSQYKENCYTVYLKGIKPILKALNLLQNKHIPSIYLYSSVLQRVELLRGLMDSDGYVSKSGNSCFYNNNYELIDSVYYLAASLNANPTVTSKKATLYGKDCGICYRVNVRPNKINPFFLSRKASRFKPCSQQDNKRFITNVVEVPYEPLKCIQVEGEIYLAGKALIPTHNSTLIAILCLYEFYNLIVLDNPAKHYGLLPGSPIAILAVAQSQDQVKETLFKAIRGYSEQSNYFSSLIKTGKIHLGAEEIKCDEKKVSIFAKHTNSKSLVGYSVKCLILDEAARFEFDEFGKSKADGIWDNVGRAVLSRFGKYGKKIAISSAWEPNDYIEKLYDVATKTISTLGFRLKTWQVNLSVNSTEHIIKSSEDYVKDPITAALEYEGIRTLKQGTFFIKDNVRAAFRGLSACDAIQIPLDITNKQGDTRTYTGVEIKRLKPLLLTQSFAHCDYGVKKDGAALAVVSPVEVEPNKWGISVDILMLWKPYVDTDKYNKAVKRIVSFVNCETIFLEVAKARRVNKFSFDSYQSEHTIQKLHLAGFNTVEMSTATQEQNRYYTTTKNLIDQGLLLLPKDSTWASSAELELQNIIQLPNGKITHSVYAKDLSDAICNATYNCYSYMLQTGIINNGSSLISSISTVNGSNSINPSAIQRIKAKDNWVTGKLKRRK